MQLGDLGADVVKIEEPSKGDESRTYGPPFLGGESAYFLSVNRNKRSCTIDLKSPAGKELLVRLATVADVVIENFRPGTLERLGLGYEILSRDNPRLILCGISGFGRTGPDADRPGYDLIIQGEAGFMDITGDPDGPPTKAGTSIADLVTGLYATQAVLAALIRRDKTDRGGRVDVACSMRWLRCSQSTPAFISRRARAPVDEAMPTQRSVPTRPSGLLTAGSTSASPTTNSGLSCARRSNMPSCEMIHASRKRPIG
jgi:crotonobetainyl-CoA:carnitine CoA-transferase CaiB-like acyl-CoA transferase